MQESKDFIEREIQKLTLFKKEFDLSITALLEMENDELEGKINSFYQDHLEKLTEIMYHISKNAENQVDFQELNRSELTQKTIFLLDYLNRNSSTFSMERMKMKQDLEQSQLKQCIKK